MRLRIVYGDLLKQSLQRQTVAERPKLSCTRDTFSVLGHTRAVIAVYILFHRVTRYILYRFKVTGSLHFASNLQYSHAEPTGNDTITQTPMNNPSGSVIPDQD